MSGKQESRAGYRYQLVNIDCLPSSDHFNIIMELEESMEEVLPYLAACIPGCTYIHGTGVIHFMDAGHIVSIYPRRVTITDVTGPGDADGLCEHYFQKMLDARSRKETITPAYEKRSSITVLDIFRLLPKTNCRLCQSASCMAFAAKVFRRECAITDCDPVIREPENHRELFLKLETNGYEVP